MTTAETTIRSEQEIRQLFSRMEQEYPELVQAMQVLNVSYNQYLAMLEAATQPTTVTGNSATLAL